MAASLYYAVTGQCPTSCLDRKLKNVGLLKPKQLANISDELNRAILQGMELEAKNRPQSMQEWLKLLEMSNLTVPVSLPPKKRRTIPWGWSTVFLLIYAVLGFLSSASALALALVLTSDLALSLASALSLVLALAFALTLVLAVALALVWAWALAFAWGWASVPASVPASEELFKSFSKFHTFLILLGTSWLGLGLGWLVYQIFPIFR